jgi:hypothetical protein
MGEGGTYETHSFAHDKHDGLVRDRLWACEEKEGQGDVKQAERANNRASSDESHDCDPISYFLISSLSLGDRNGRQGGTYDEMKSIGDRGLYSFIGL